MRIKPIRKEGLRIRKEAEVDTTQIENELNKVDNDAGVIVVYLNKLDISLMDIRRN